MRTARNVKATTDYPAGSIRHYKYYSNEYERIKELADNTTGDMANQLYCELDGIVLILEEYEPL